jgi:hypothetical protein
MDSLFYSFPLHHTSVEAQTKYLSPTLDVHAATFPSFWPELARTVTSRRKLPLFVDEWQSEL